MAFLRVNTDFDNTITEVSNSPIGNLQPNEFQATTTYAFPTSQPVYYYRWNGSDIEGNSDANIQSYEGTITPPPEPQDPANVTVGEYTGLTATTVSLQEQIDALSGVTGLTAVQGRRTSTFSNIPLSWTDFDFEATDVETDDSILEHDDTLRDRFLIKKTGLYLLSYTLILDDEGETRVRVNDTSVIPGSIGLYGNTGDAVDLNGNMPKTFVVQLTAGDFVTLQVQANSGAENIFAESTMVIILLEGIQGPKGDTGSGSSVTLENDDTPVAGTPHDTINFDDNFTVTNDGGGKATVSLDINVSPTANKIQLVDSAGGQALNDVTPNPIEWGQEDVKDASVFTFTAGNSNITVLQSGWYEISYNVNGAGGGNRSVVGVNVRNNGTAINPTLSGSYVRNSSNNDSTNAIPPYLIQLSANDVIDITAFRLGDSTGVSSKAGASFVRINYLG